MMMNYTKKTPPRPHAVPLASARQPASAQKPEGKPGRPFVGARGGGPGGGRTHPTWVHSPGAEGGGWIKVGGSVVAKRYYRWIKISSSSHQKRGSSLSTLAKK